MRSSWFIQQWPPKLCLTKMVWEMGGKLPCNFMGVAVSYGGQTNLKVQQPILNSSIGKLLLFINKGGIYWKKKNSHWKITILRPFVQTALYYAEVWALSKELEKLAQPIPKKQLWSVLEVYKLTNYETLPREKSLLFKRRQFHKLH